MEASSEESVNYVFLTVTLLEGLGGIFFRGRVRVHFESGPRCGLCESYNHIRD